MSLSASDTAMSAAFKAARIATPAARLRQVATAVLAAYGRNHIAATQALIDAVRGDAGLMWALMEGQREKLALEYLRGLMDELRTQEPESGGQWGRENRHMVAAVSRAEPDGAAGQFMPDCLGGRARPPSAPDRSGVGQNPDVPHDRLARPAATPGRTTRGLASLQTVAPTMARCVLDTLPVNGKPIGDNTPEEALPVAEHRERDARLIRALCHGVPPGTRIREVVNPQEAERRARLAQEVNHAA